MIVTYGHRYPKGFLPAASVETEADAELLLERCCEPVYIESTQTFGYIASELEKEQTIANLYAFGARLEAEYQKILAERKTC